MIITAETGCAVRCISNSMCPGKSLGIDAEAHGAASQRDLTNFNDFHCCCEKLRLMAIDVCVLIPCFNNLPGLIAAVSSIQYHPSRMRILVVDDGSEIPVSLRGASIGHQIPVDILRLRKNLGITCALNTGLDYINQHYTPRFIARLDCGDTCSPLRFYRQVEFMDKHSEIELLGSWCYFLEPASGSSYSYITPTKDRQIRRSMYFRNVFIHPTVMWRPITGNKIKYPEKYPYAEDYGLFYDILKRSRTAILAEFLVTCQINPGGITLKNRAGQLKSRLKVVSDYGSSKLMVFFGTVKLYALLTIPYRVIQLLKMRLYKT